MSRGPGKWQAMILDQVQDQGFCALVDLASGERPAARRAARMLAAKGMVDLRQVGPENRLVALRPGGKYEPPEGTKPQQLVKVGKGKKGAVTLRLFCDFLLSECPPAGALIPPCRSCAIEAGRGKRYARRTVSSLWSFADHRDYPRHTTHCHPLNKTGRVLKKNLSHPVICPTCGETRMKNAPPCCHRHLRLPTPEGWARDGRWTAGDRPAPWGPKPWWRKTYVVPPHDPRAYEGYEYLVAGEFDLLADKMLKDFGEELQQGRAQPAGGYERHRPEYQPDLLPHRAVIDEDERRHEYKRWYWSYLQAPSNWLDPNYLTDEELRALLADPIPERPPAATYTPATDDQCAAAFSAAVAFRDNRKRQTRKPKTESRSERAQVHDRKRKAEIKARIAKLNAALEAKK